MIKTNRTTVHSEIRRQTVDLEMSWIRIALKLRFCFLDFRAKYSHLRALLTNCKDLLVMHDAKRRICRNLISKSSENRLCNEMHYV